MPALKLILGSSSPYRKSLLQRLMIPFETVDPDIDESPLPGETPVALVRRLALEKARAVASLHLDCLIIGSDQVAVHDDQVVGKPSSHEQAVKQLSAASGKTVTLYTGLALVNSYNGSEQSAVAPFTVHFKTLSKQTIEAYLHKEKPYNCAGSVRAEGLGIALLRRLEGDDPNALIGLPLIELVTMLENEDYPLFG